MHLRFTARNITTTALEYFIFIISINYNALLAGRDLLCLGLYVGSIQPDKYK